LQRPTFSKFVNSLNSEITKFFLPPVITLDTALARAAQPTQLWHPFFMPAIKLLLLVPMAAAALVTPDGTRNAAAGVQRMSRRSVFLGAAGALLSAPMPAARAETPVNVEVPVKTTDYKGFNLFGEGSAERCESGEGAACDKLAGGSELILELQKQSRTNKEKRARWSAQGAAG